MADTKWKPGKPKTGGRQKGTPNKKTQEFLVMLEKNNFDPGEEYVALYRKQMAIYNHRIKPVHGRANLAGALIALADASTSLNNICQFVYPKKKAIEHSGEVGVRTFADFIAAGDPENTDAKE